MKVINGKLEPKNLVVDLEFRKALKKALKEWFDLRLTDLPIIIKRIGIEEENYDLLLRSQIIESERHLDINVVTAKETTRIILNRGTMISPYPSLIVNGKDYYLGRKVEVEEITIPKATEISEQAYRELIKLMEDE